MVHLKIETETFTGRGDVAGASELIADTPSAIARIFRAGRWAHEMVVSTEMTKDPNGRPLSFDWVLLQGDPERVEIEPLDPEGTRARLRVVWHEPFDVPARGEQSTRRTNRVDIAIIASNGVEDSAPAMISVAFPPHQLREYGEVAGETRLLSIDYDADKRLAPADPLLFWTGQWRDRMDYAPDGRLRGWTREQGDTRRAFAADGRLITGAEIRYRLERRPSGLPLMHPEIVD